MYNKPIRDIRVSSRKVFFSLFAYCSSLLFLVGPIDVPNTFPSVPPSRRRAEQPRCFPDYGAAKPRAASLRSHVLPRRTTPSRPLWILASFDPSEARLQSCINDRQDQPTLCIEQRNPIAWSPVFYTRNVPPPIVFEEKNRFCAFSVIVSFFFCFFWDIFFSLVNRFSRTTRSYVAEVSKRRRSLVEWDSLPSTRTDLRPLCVRSFVRRTRPAPRGLLERRNRSSGGMAILPLSTR